MRIRTWILVVAATVVGTHAVRADQVTLTMAIRHAVRVDPTCTGDMTPRKQALLQFLRVRDFVALDLADRSEGDADAITARHSAWVGRMERLIRRAASTNPAAR